VYQQTPFQSYEVTQKSECPRYVPQSNSYDSGLTVHVSKWHCPLLVFVPPAPHPQTVISGRYSSTVKIHKAYGDNKCKYCDSNNTNVTVDDWRYRLCIRMDFIYRYMREKC